MRDDARPFKLPANWKSFDFTFTGSFGAGDARRSESGYNMLKPAVAIVFQTLTVSMGNPIWIDTPKTNGELKVPIKTSSTASFGVKVILKGCFEISQAGFVQAGGEWSYVTLKGLGIGKDAPCIFTVEPNGTANVDLQLNAAEKANDVRCNANICSWSVKPTKAFVFNKNPTLEKFEPVVNLTARSITVGTLADIKTLTLRLDDENEIKDFNRDSDNQYTFTLTENTLKTLEDGNHTLVFEGESIDGIQLSDKKTFAFTKKTKPEFIGYPQFAVEQNGGIRLTYNLSGNFDAARNIVTLTYKGKTDKVSGAINEPACASTAANPTVQQCSTTLSVGFNDLSDEARKMATVPVILTITALEKSTLASTSQSFGFDLLNQAAVKAKLDEIKSKPPKTDNEAAEAKKQIAAALALNLGNTDDAKTVENVFKKFIKETNDSKSKIFLKGLIRVGNIALKGFGIPITIPPGLLD